MEKKFSVKNLIFYISILIILVSFGYYTSYAFFSAVVEGNEDATNTEVTLANIETIFETTSYIDNQRLIPLLSTEVDEQAKKVEFTVTNTENSNIAVEYDIYLEDFLISDNFKASEDLRYKITKIVDNTEVLVEEGNFTESTSGENFKLTTTKETLNYNSSRDYILRIWIHDTEEEQPDLLEGTISGRVSVIGKIANYKCIRATILHTEKCNQNDETMYCSSTNESENGFDITHGDDILFGNQIYTLGTFTTGDAFTCDVNGDGTFDEETERFYYVSDLWEGSTNTFDQNYAVLIYYTNTIIEEDTIIQDEATGVKYHEDNYNYEGPVNLLQHLPDQSENQWKNVYLKSHVRQIYNEKNKTNADEQTLPNYLYRNKAARLITYQELAQGCGLTSSNRSTVGILDTSNCRFLFENTVYVKSSNVFGYWLETPRSSNSYGVWLINSSYRNIYIYDSNNSGLGGVRPTIEVLKRDIVY